MKKIGEVLKRKGDQVWSIRPDASVYEAIELMSRKEIGALVVLEGSGIAGMVSERDYARNVILKGRSSRDARVSEIMSRRTITVGPEYSVQECMELMTEKRVRHLPVVEGGRLLGLVSMGDLVKAVISEQRFMIEQLERYINGWPIASTA